MSNTLVKNQTEEVLSFLETTVSTLESFLNQTTLTGLYNDKEEEEGYYKGLLSSLRRILVYCEEGLEACKIVLKNETFNKGAAEKTLYTIYHQCIEEFYSPRLDLWYEDSRSAYTGKNSIKFHQPVSEQIEKLFTSLEGAFQNVREELEYYETDYRTKMLHSK